MLVKAIIFSPALFTILQADKHNCINSGRARVTCFLEFQGLHIEFHMHCNDITFSSSLLQKLT